MGLLAEREGMSSWLTFSLFTGTHSQSRSNGDIQNQACSHDMQEWEQETYFLEESGGQIQAGTHFMQE